MTSNPILRSKRRLISRVLLWIGVLSLLVVVGLTGVAAWLWSQAQLTNVGELRFANPLKIPPLLEPRIDEDGRKVYVLKLLSEDGRVFTVRIDAATGRMR